MNLAINQGERAVADDNPYALTEGEQKVVEAWNAMTSDERGEYLWHAKQEQNIRDFIAQADMTNYMNDQAVQHLAGGGAVVGGELRPDALVTIGGVEMTVAQAVDAGVWDSSTLGMHTADMLYPGEEEG